MATLLTAAPSSAASVDWTPLPGGNEALRFTGSGLPLQQPADTRYDGSTLLFTAARGTSGVRQQFSLRPGQDVPSARPVLYGDVATTSRIRTPEADFTTTQAPGGTAVHRIANGVSTLVGVFSVPVYLVAANKQELTLWGNPHTYSVSLIGEGAGGFQIGTTFIFTAAGRSYLYRETAPGHHRWTRINPDSTRTHIDSVDGVDLAPGIGRPVDGIAFGSGVVVVADHQVHGRELWFLAHNSATPVLLTNITTGGATPPMRLLGVRDGRVWFTVGDAVQKVFSTGGTFADIREEMPDPLPTVVTPSVNTVGTTFVTSRPSGLHAYRPGLAAPQQLLGLDIKNVVPAPDGRTLYVVTGPSASRDWYVTNGTLAGTKRLNAHVPAGYQRATQYAAVVPGPSGAFGYQLVSQGQRQQFLQRPDRTVRLLKVTAPAKQRQRRSRVTVKVTARAGERVTSTATGSIRIAGSKPIKITPQRLTTAKDRAGTLKLTVPRATRARVHQALRNKRKVVAVVKIRVRDANAGNTVIRTVKVRLL